MSDEYRQPLTPDQYAPGSTVSQDGQKLRVEGRLSADAGNAYLIVSDGNSAVCGLVLEGTIRDTFDAEEPETPSQDPNHQGTDGTDGTDDPDSPPASDSPNETVR